MKTRNRIRLVFWGGLLLLTIVSVRWMTAMPGSSASEALPEATELELALALRLEADLRALAE